MNSSSERLEAFAKECSDQARDPGFGVIVAFEYHDGPESGVAVYPSGAGVYFSVLGESRSRLFRAFELSAIEGNWLQRVGSLQKKEAVSPPPHVLVPSNTELERSRLLYDVSNASSKGSYVGVGTPSLNDIQIVSASRKQIEDLRVRGRSEAGFRIAHELVKRGKAGT